MKPSRIGSKSRLGGTFAVSGRPVRGIAGPNELTLAERTVTIQGGTYKRNANATERFVIHRRHFHDRPAVVGVFTSLPLAGTWTCPRCRSRCDSVELIDLQQRRSRSPGRSCVKRTPSPSRSGEKPAPVFPGPTSLKIDPEVPVQPVRFLTRPGKKLGRKLDTTFSRTISRRCSTGM